MDKKIVVWCMILLFNVLSLDAGNIKGVVVSSRKNAPVQGANISIFRADSLIYNVHTDSVGRFAFSLAKGKYHIQIKKDKYLTIEDSLQIAASNEARDLKFVLEKSIMLNEIVVKADPLYVKNIEDGIVYNLSKDKYANQDNLLNALKRIPLLMVNSDGTINVAGKSNYAVYLNGKPYNMANADPSRVLRSISSSDIKQVEVIMRPAQRFGESAPVINIITKGKGLEGYNINMNAMGGTLPKATGAASVLGIKNNIQFFAGYTYDLWGQRNQLWLLKYKFSNGSNMETLSEKNNRNRHTHLGRTMFQWDVDSLSQLYADFNINGIEHKEKIYYKESYDKTVPSSEYQSTSDTWDVSMEANIIYLIRFKKSNSQKWRFGYRFTLNPDNRIYKIKDLSTPSMSVAKTNGRLYTHNFQLYRRVNFTKKLFSFFTLNANIRRGSSLSKYSNASGMDNADEDDFGFTQLLGSLSWKTIWYFTKTKDFWFDITNKLEYAKDKSTDMEAQRRSFSYLPALKLTWQPNWNNELSIAFTSTVNRPSLQMLNPFIGGQTNNDVQQGSPELHDARTYSLTLDYSFLSKKIAIYPTISGSITRNAIMSVYDSNQTYTQVIETYSNISQVKMLSFELFLSFRPWKWLKLLSVSSVGIQNINSDKMSLNQSDGFYRSTSVVAFYMPSAWQFETSFSAYRQTPQAWIRYQPGAMYSFSLSKTLMNGNMSVKFFVDSPFYTRGVHDSRAILSAPGLSFDKLWKTNVRCIGIDVSLNLQVGKKAGIKRNTSLKDNDIQTGVAN